MTDRTPAAQRSQAVGMDPEFSVEQGAKRARRTCGGGGGSEAGSSPASAEVCALVASASGMPAAQAIAREASRQEESASTGGGGTGGASSSRRSSAASPSGLTPRLGPSGLTLNSPSPVLTLELEFGASGDSPRGAAPGQGGGGSGSATSGSGSTPRSGGSAHTPIPSASSMPPPPMLGGRKRALPAIARAPASTPTSAASSSPGLLSGTDDEDEQPMPQTPSSRAHELGRQLSSHSGGGGGGEGGEDDPNWPEELRDAVTGCDADAASSLIAGAASAAAVRGWFAEKDENGYTLLMDAVSSLGGSAQRTAMVKAALDNGACVLARDNEGFTPIHWAAASGNEDVLRQLAEANANVHAVSKEGETALHRSARLGHAAVCATLLSLGCPPLLRNKENHTAADVAGQFEPGGKINKSGRAAVRRLLYEAAPTQKTLVLYHVDCLGHATGHEHQEAPERLVVIMAKVRNAKLFESWELEIREQFPVATTEQVLRAHTAPYLRHLREMEASVEEGSVVPFTPAVQRHVLAEEESNVKDEAKADTAFSSGSLRAALAAAGAVVHAADAVLASQFRNAFCVVRPPGHHAGFSGLDASASSCGFCLLNNVAIGALHALHTQPRLCRRVAIVDFDVHHGNGTEQIVEEIGESERLMFFSVHLFDNPTITGPGVVGEACCDDGGGGGAGGPTAMDADGAAAASDGANESPLGRAQSSNSAEFNAAAAARGVRPPVSASEDAEFYPGTGGHDIAGINVINAPLTPLWRVGKTRSSSTARSDHEGKFEGGYKSRGGSRARAKEAEAGEAGGSSGGSPGSGLVGGRSSGSRSSNESEDAASPATPAMHGRSAWREVIKAKLAPALSEFAPSLILLSSGFDGGKNDRGNVRIADGEPGLDLREEDFAWMVEQMQVVANDVCEGRIVSVLEGGYGVLEKKAGAWGYDRENLARNASAHLRALVGKKK